MPQDAEMTAIPPTTEPAAPSAAAERMRRHRQRRRDGLRCLGIELRETEIDALIRKGLLKPETRNDTSAIIDVLYAYLDHTLGCHRDAKRYYLLSYSKISKGFRYGQVSGKRATHGISSWMAIYNTRALTYAARKGRNIQMSQPKAKNASTE
jgi:hypothetical protein